MLIFLPAILLGLGWMLFKSRFDLKACRIPHWRAVGLLPIALLWMLPVLRPQMLFLTPLTETWASLCLLAAQSMLLLFVFLNLHQPGMWILGIGFLLNLICMQANGGLMPLEPEKIPYLFNQPDLDPTEFLGQRLGNSKDIVLEKQATRFWMLSDRFVLPESFPYRVAFSLGDLVLAVGLFTTLASASPGKSGNHSGVDYEYDNHQTHRIICKNETGQ